MAQGRRHPIGNTSNRILKRLYAAKHDLIEYSLTEEEKDLLLFALIEFTEDIQTAHERFNRQLNRR